MRPRAALILIALVACDRGAQNTALDGSEQPDAGIVDDTLPDASEEPETVAPVLLRVEPTAEMWLHEPVRFVFDEPVDISAATVTATLDGAPVAATLSVIGERVVQAHLDPAVRGVGNVHVALGGSVKDKWGNVAALPLDADLTAAAWHRPAVDRGTATETPAIAAGSSYVLVAWIADGSIVASRYTGLWTNLGASMGTNVSSVTASIDAMDRPLVGWIENGAAHVSRWEANAWHELASPGAGTRIVLAGASAAVFGASAQIRTLDAADLWQPAGDFPVGALTGMPAFTGTAVGWVEGGTIRVYNNGVAMAPIDVESSTRLSLASQNGILAAAWDEFGGSSNVIVALANGTAWQRLGRMLDIDPAGNATSPAVALDGAGRPVVAWRERVEVNERGVVARWTGSTWATMGDSQWHTTGVPAAPALVLHDDAPFVATTAGGALELARWNGPATIAAGFTRASRAGCSVDPANPPSTLFATGCFSAGATPHAGLVPYDIVNELWTDGTKKRRWIGLPDGAQMTQLANDSWAAPAGTIIAKEFAVETTPGNPATRRPVETRLLVNTGGAWTGFSYQWRTDGSNADLLNDGTFTKDWPLDAGGAYRHLYPSRSQCLSCHNGSMGPLLGVRPQQLTRWMDYGGAIADQMQTLAAIGVGPATNVAPYISTHDRTASWEQRTRSYMAANCQHCHNPNDIAIKDLRYTTPLAQTRLCEVIVPGAPANSVVWAKVTQRPGMPPLGTLAVDPLPGQLVGNWISGMTSCP